MGELARIRQGVIEAGQARRASWSADEAAGAVGQEVLLVGVDPTSQSAHDTGRAILHRAGRRRVAIPMDMAWAQRVGQLREIQTLLGFAREERWDALATVLEVRAAAERPERSGAPGAPGAPGAAGATPEVEATPEMIVKLGPIWVQGQLVLEADGSVPGLEAAMKALDRLQAGIVVSHATPKPELLLPLLFKILETHHWRAFRELYDDKASGSDKKVAFDQFRLAWDAARGEVSFDGYVEPQAQVDAAVEGAVVRTRLKRPGQKGEVLVRPLKWIKRGAGWRLAGGLM